MQSRSHGTHSIIASAFILMVASGCAETRVSPSSSIVPSSAESESAPAPSSASGGCTLQVWTETNPIHGSSANALVNERVWFAGTFVGNATVEVVVTIDGQETLRFSKSGEADGTFMDSVRFEPNEAGKTATITVTVPETECAASVQVEVAGPQ